MRHRGILIVIGLILATPAWAAPTYRPGPHLRLDADACKSLRRISAASAKPNHNWVKGAVGAASRLFSTGTTEAAQEVAQQGAQTAVRVVTEAELKGAYELAKVMGQAVHEVMQKHSTEVIESTIAGLVRSRAAIPPGVLKATKVLELLKGREAAIAQDITTKLASRLPLSEATAMGKEMAASIFRSENLAAFARGTKFELLQGAGMTLTALKTKLPTLVPELAASLSRNAVSSYQRAFAELFANRAIAFMPQVVKGITQEAKGAIMSGCARGLFRGLPVIGLILDIAIFSDTAKADGRSYTEAMSDDPASFLEWPEEKACQFLQSPEGALAASRLDRLAMIVDESEAPLECVGLAPETISSRLTDESPEWSVAGNLPESDPVPVSGAGR